MVDRCAGVLEAGKLGGTESSMTKVAVPEALMRVADRCVQVVGGTGVTSDTIAEQVFRELRAFRICNGPNEVHKWSLAKKIKRDWQERALAPPPMPARRRCATRTASTRACSSVGMLERWLEEHVEGYRGPLTVEQFKGGQSNPTYKFVTPSRSYVLRRKPPGPLLKGAHAIGREARMLSALGPVDFLVARVYAMCTDDTIIGWFFIIEMMEGRIF